MTDEPMQLTIDLTQRDLVLEAHQRRDLVRWLEWKCYDATFWLGDGTTTAVSANTARAILKAHGISVADTRFLGGVFPVARWEQVAEIHSDSGRCHARKIRTFRPREGAVIEEVPFPTWL